MPEPHPILIFIPEIKSLISQKGFDELKDFLLEINPIDLADGFPQFPPEHQLLIFKLLDPRRAIAVFEELDLLEQEYLIQHLEDLTLTPLLADIPAEVARQLFQKLPERSIKRMSGLMKKERIKTVQNVLVLPVDSAGTLMKTEFIPLNQEMVARAAIEYIQANMRVRKEEGIHSLYITNNDFKLVGSINLSTLIAAPRDIKIKEIMSPVSFIKILASMDQEEAAKIFSRYKLISAPVVDENNCLVGVITADDIMQVIQEEDTEDIQKLAGMEVLDKPYFDVSFSKMVQKRGTWLCVLFLGEMLTATAMGFFEGEIAKAVVLALFIPLIISSGGNSGSQAATLIVRAMALKEITFGDWWRVLKREFASGLTMGSVLGAIGFFRIYIWSQFSDIYGPHYLLVALTVAASLVLVVLWGTLSGSLLPIALRRAGLDPAVVSAPFVATLVDVTGLIIYFSVGIFFLRGTLL